MTWLKSTLISYTKLHDDSSHITQIATGTGRQKMSLSLGGMLPEGKMLSRQWELNS
jgi:hypothetical protein